jgi:hypothetical protein
VKVSPFTTISDWAWKELRLLTELLKYLDVKIDSTPNFLRIRQLVVKTARKVRCIQRDQSLGRHLAPPIES